MERDMKKIIETLQAHEADNALINDVLVMILNNQIESAKVTKNVMIDIRDNFESERTNMNEMLETIKEFTVDLAERLVVLEKKL
tara:strand:- start:651 stop:902 length:252 start_codon:yes stop_codon:yes gene_type:complete